MAKTPYGRPFVCYPLLFRSCQHTRQITRYAPLLVFLQPSDAQNEEVTIYCARFVSYFLLLHLASCGHNIPRADASLVAVQPLG